METEVTYKFNENDVKRLTSFMLLKFMMAAMSKDDLNRDAIHADVMEFVKGMHVKS